MIRVTRYNDGRCGIESGARVSRSVPVIVYSPEEKNVKENVREWVQLIAAKSPGARIVLVSTHSKSVKLEGSSVEKLAKEVEQEVQAEIKVVNTGTKEEASRLEKKIEAFKERERAATDDNERQQLSKELEAEKERLRSLTESEDGKKTMKEVSLLSGQVWCVDSVEGDGVVELREVLKKEIGELPFVGELVPAQWVHVKKTVEDKYREIAGKQLVSKQELISCLDLEREEWEGNGREGGVGGGGVLRAAGGLEGIQGQRTAGPSAPDGVEQGAGVPLPHKGT